MNEKNIFAKFEAEGAFSPSKGRALTGNTAVYLLYLIEIVFLVYSGYHGISASLLFAGDGLAKIPQIAGIVILEFTLLGLSLAWHCGKIIGSVQTFIAISGYAILFILACLGIVGDSQLHAGYPVTSWLATYLQWGLPIAPAIAGIIALLVISLSPNQIQSRLRDNQQNAFSDATFEAYMVQEAAQARAQLQIKGLQIGSQVEVAKLISEQINSPQVTAAIRQTALANIPALLQTAGIHLTDDMVKQLGVPNGQSVTGANLDGLEHGVSRLKVVTNEAKTETAETDFLSETAVRGVSPSPHLNGQYRQGVSDGL